MAVAESIKVALRALEEESAWAQNLGQCFVAAAGDDQGLKEPPWVNQFKHVVEGIGQRVEALAHAINRESDHG